MTHHKSLTLFLALVLATACGDEKADSSPDESGCPTATKIKDGNGFPTGFENCEGVINRVEAVTADPAIQGETCHGDEDSKLCETNADCTTSGQGYCLHDEYSFSDFSWCACAYSCASDAECGDGLACVSGAVSENLKWSQCVTATCRSSEDCASGECGLSEWEDTCDESTTVLLACRNEDDACRLDSDCAEGEQCVSIAEVWTCKAQECE